MIVSSSWQAMVSLVVRLVGQAYSIGQVVIYPDQKKDKWSRIDKKLTLKFGTDRSPRQRSYRSSQGKANYYLIRWEHLSVILRSTKGEPDFKVEEGENFKDLRYYPLLLPIGDVLELSIRLEQAPKSLNSNLRRKKYAATLRLSRACYKDTKKVLEVAAASKRIRECQRLIENINGIPAHRGTIEQMRGLEFYARKKLRQNSVKVPPHWITIRTHRKSLQVINSK